jgi:hypothetical protein
MSGNYDLHNVYTYLQRYAIIRAMAGDLASKILRSTPPSREQSLALTKLEECVFWANTSIARNEPDPAVNPEHYHA